MIVAELLSQLRDLGIRLWVQEDQLRYKAPQGALTPALRAELVAHKADIITLLREAQMAVESASEPIRPLPQEKRQAGELPLSFAQQRLWFLDQLEPASAAYNLPAAYRLQGPLDVSALTRCLDEIVRRHEVLRTTFSTVDEQPVQVIAPETKLVLPVIDLGALAGAVREREARRLANREAQRPFDLARDPLLRVMLLQLGQACPARAARRVSKQSRREEHAFLVTMHHIVSDGWSIDVFNRQLSALYEAFSAGKPAPVTALPVQYADYAAWQREGLQGEALDAQLAYWRERLVGSPPMLELPADRPRPPVQSFRGVHQPFTLPQALSEALKALSQREGVTLFTTLLAAFKALLYRYTGQTDVVIGLPVANRNRPELEELIGFFVNTLVLRTDLSGNPTFRALLSRVREVTLDAHAHQDLPFEKLVQELQPERNLSHNPLFQVMFAFQDAPEALALSGLDVSPLPVYTKAVKFDWVLAFEDAGTELKGYVEYSTDLFDAATIGRMLAHYQTLLAGIVASPEGIGRRLSDLPLLTDVEQRQLLVEWNNLATTNEVSIGYLPKRCFHHLFEAQVEQRPTATAVTFERQALTYQELNRRANQLASRLQKMGVEPETLVGICVERSLEMMVGVLGILKAGGAYLPLDPTLPQERLAFMLQDARPAVLLTQAHLREQMLALPHPSQVLCLDVDWPAVAQESIGNPASGVAVDNLAYVIYTSGSTGLPKGVWVTHRGIDNISKAQVQTFGVGPGSRVLQFSNFTFDASVCEMIMALGVGATLYLGTREALLPGEDLLRFLRHARITVAILPPSALAALPFHDLPLLKTLAVAGEACPAELVACWVLGREFFNLYGPTEDTIWTTVARCVGGHQKPPIGRPIANTQVYVLDAHLQPVPVGVPGELHIGGVGLARGYLNRPDLTATKFIPNPFLSIEGEGARLYKTGDLVRYLLGGDIEFLGRIDHQVKIRGYRIELGEIEAVLGRHPLVREAAVLAREDVPGDKRLVAYLVPADEEPEPTDAASLLRSAPLVNDLRSYLKEKLPDYMVPSVFVTLEALPWTSSGKIDRRALPAPDGARAKGAYAAPRTPIEEQLATMMAQILDLDRVGINDDFFALGGHSLLATQLVSRVNRAFQISLPVRAVFEGASVARLAQLVIGKQLEQRIGNTTGLEAQISPIPTSLRDQSVPLSFGQQRLWFLDQLSPGSPVYNIPVTHRLSGPLDVAALERSLNEIVRRHEALRTTFVTVDGQPVQVIAPAWVLSLPLIDLGGLDSEREAEARRLSTQEAQRPFDLARGPLVRVTCLRLGSREHVLLLTMHHIISDEWSVEVFHRELSALYAAFAVSKQPRRAGRKQSPLPDLPIQYGDFAVWQREWLEGDVLEAQLDHWKQQLSDLPPALELPADHPQPAVQTFRGAFLSSTFPEALHQALQTFSQREGVTLFTTLLAGFKALLYRYTRQADVVVGSPVANRNRLEIEGLIGFFVNTLVLRTDLSGNPTFRDLLGRVREVTLDAYAHQDLPFEMLVQELRPERSLGQNPLFQVMFSFQSVSSDALELAGLKVRSAELETGTSKFDLMLTVNDAGQALDVMAEYNTDRFEAATIVRMMAHFQIVLEGFVATPEGPERRVADLPLLTAAERRQLLLAWNDTAVDYSRDVCLPAPFEVQAAQRPEMVALVSATTDGESQHVTCGELNRRANQLAHYLQRLGVTPESAVGICIERSPEMVVSLLGVLKAGATYVPLDPAYPQERLAFMLADTQAQLLLTQQRLLEHLPAPLLPTPYSILLLDDQWHLITQESAANPSYATTPENLAYVIYTSGSTGRPKGVAIAHRSAVTLIHWARQVFDGEHLAGTLASTSICFDLSIFELFVPLSWGGTVILAETALQLPTLPAAGAVTLVNTVPSALRELLRAEGIPPAVRTVDLAGEPLPTSLVREIYVRGRIGQVFDLYGPSEDTTYSTYALRSAEGPDTIGRPIANTQAYVLDAHLNLVPVGVPGELYLGGDGLARGYLRQPGQTAERFVPHPFPPLPSGHLPQGEERRGGAGARLYKTGDLARYLPDGNLEFLGRVDHQVKLRGFRIELGEIEAVLGGHPQVQDAVVTARDTMHAPADKQLVAYVVPRDGQTPATSNLRHFLKQKLPEYMIPSAFVTLETLPLTPNGKVDRRALPAPDHFAGEGVFVASRTPIEEMLVDVWAQVLGVERVGVYDDFFALGGHSLLAAQIISRLRQLFGGEFTVRTLFEAPTVAALTERLEAGRRDEAGESAPPITRVSQEGTLPLSYSQQQLWLVEQLAPGNAAYNLPLALRLSGPLNVTALHESLNEIVRRHEALRTTFPVKNRRPGQAIAASLLLSLPVVDVRQWPEDEREAEVLRLARTRARQPFDLAQGPLVRADLFQLQENDHLLLITVHHIIFDGWSVGVFVTELGALYQAFCAGKPAPLPELSVQYADYAAWQRARLQGDALEKSLAYWRRQLLDAPAVMALPTDRLRPPIQTFRGAEKLFEISHSLREKLNLLSRREGVTLFMTLLAAFKTLLYGYTGQTDVIVGTPVANRNRPEIEGLVGYFVNVLVLRTSLADDPTLRELLARVRETTLGAHAHQDLPFEKLVETLRPERDTSYNPLFQVMLSWNVATAEPDLPGLSVTRVTIDTGVYQSADLHLELEETPQGLVGALCYNTDLFDDAIVTRMVKDFQTLLEKIVATRDAPGQNIATWVSEMGLGQRRTGGVMPTSQDAASFSLKDEIAHSKSELAGLRSKLSAAQRARLEQRLRGK